MIYYSEYWYMHEIGMSERLHTIVYDFRIIFAVHRSSTGTKVLSIEECDDLIKHDSRVIMNNYKMFLLAHPSVCIHDQSELSTFFSSFGLLMLTGPYLDIYNKIGLLLAL